MNLTDKQMEWIRWLALCVLIAVFGFLGLQTPGVPVLPSGGDINLQSTNQKIVTNRAGDTLNVLSGGQFNMSAGSTAVFNGALAATVIRINGTPVVPYATPMSTATPPGNITATVVAASTVVVGGTPVFWATPQAIVNGASNGYIRCNFNVITGTVTATPVAGATVIGYPWASLGAVSGDSARPYASYTAGTFTVGVMNSALTPVANATPADVEWCYYYTK
jgi:hypothetical protein